MWKLWLIPITWVVSFVGVLWGAFAWVYPWLISLAAPAWVAGILVLLAGGWLGFWVGTVLSLIVTSVLAATEK